MAHAEDMTSATPDASLALEAKNRRLQTLVGELLATNQKLRFEVAELQRRTRQLERGLTESCATAGALWP